MSPGRRRDALGPGQAFLAICFLARLGVVATGRPAVLVENVQVALIQKRGGHRRSRLVPRPGYELIRLLTFLERDVALCPGFDGNERAVAERPAVADINHRFVRGRRSVAAAVERVAFPNHVAVGRIISNRPLGAEANQLGPTFGLPHKWRAPRRLVAAFLAPNLLAGHFVERHQERLLLIVALHIETIADQGRGAAGAKTKHHVVGTEFLGPDLLAVQIEAIETGHAKVSVDALAVGDGRFGGIRVGRVRGDGGFVLGGGLFPQCLAGAAIETVHFPAVDCVRWLGVAHARESAARRTTTRTPAPAAGRAHRPATRRSAATWTPECKWLGLGLFLGNRSGHEYLVADNDWRRPGDTGDFDLPLNVLVQAPLRGQFGHRRQ